MMLAETRKLVRNKPWVIVHNAKYNETFRIRPWTLADRGRTLQAKYVGSEGETWGLFARDELQVVQKGEV